MDAKRATLLDVAAAADVLACAAHAAAGIEVTVIWGRPGTPRREIRATVTALPFKPDHRQVDVTSL